MSKPSYKTVLVAVVSSMLFNNLASAQSSSSFNSRVVRENFERNNRDRLNETIRKLAPIKSRLRELGAIQKRNHDRQSELIHKLEDANKLYYQYYEKKLAELRVARGDEPALQDWFNQVEERTRKSYDRDTMAVQTLLDKHHKILAKMRKTPSKAKKAKSRPSQQKIGPPTKEESEAQINKLESEIRHWSHEIRLVDFKIADELKNGGGNGQIVFGELRFKRKRIIRKELLPRINRLYRLDPGNPHSKVPDHVSRGK